MKKVALILHNIRSTHNVGSIFRTADAAGVSHIYISGYTPAPLDRFGREQKEIAKTALGAHKTVAWEQCDAFEVIKKLQSEGFTVAAVEQDEHALPLQSYTPPEKLALILGNEVRGVSKQLREKSDVVLEIPMQGEKESLNVSVATGIVLYTLLFNS